ncbi:MAG: multicopper oxidase domain-containing protein [Desulfofustis sp.]|nr:multicopper oxidase domain-containing protein [Desulfofustis sp.]
MIRKKFRGCLGAVALLALAAGGGGLAPPADAAVTPAQVRSTGVPDYNTSPNWAYSPPLQKFIDTLPGLCGTAWEAAGGTSMVNNLGQCIPVAVPDQDTYENTDYYEFEAVQYREEMHTNLPDVVAGPVVTGIPAVDAIEGGTLLRGYRQVNGITSSEPAFHPHSLGPVIIATRDRAVRIKFTNKLPTTVEGGQLFIPTDFSVMGAGPGPLHDRAGDGRTESEVCEQEPEKCFSQNRQVLHLHGGRTPWISDGTAHQWITPAGEIPDLDPRDPYYKKGTSVAYVPDMWYDSTTGAHLTGCAGQLTCSEPNATNNPGEGSQTYYWTNAQSARLMFYHDHSWGATRLNVYVGGVAGYLITDQYEQSLVDDLLIPGLDKTIPLIIQDKTFVDETTILDTDPTWIWGSKPGTLYPWDADGPANDGAPVTGDLWWPHIYVPAQNPYNPDMSGINPYGRWHYGPWFWPPTPVPFGPEVNPYFGATNPEQPPEIPGTPNPSWGAEAFLDTSVVNGTAYPRLEITPDVYRFRILNGAHDRFWNLQFYVADAAEPTEVYMVPAALTTGFPGHPGDPNAEEIPWPTDGREGGVPDPARRGPAIVQIGSDGGLLPKPVVLPNRPVNWNTDVTMFAAGNVLSQSEGGGTLFLGPAERADIIVDFSAYAGKTLILYNDAPAPWPALDFHYDYYTGNPDYTADGGTTSTPIGFGPNTRTIMQIVVSGVDSGTITPNAEPGNVAALTAAFTGSDGVFATGQEPMIVGQAAYDDNYAPTFPTTWPYWGVSRITDNAISFMTPEGALVNAYPMEPKAIQDEAGETFDDFGRMSAKLGLEMAFTTANIQTFITQNFVDPPTETVAQDQVQIWKITHNGVDTHPVHFHLFEVQLLNRVGWDGFITLPDPNEIGWKDTIRVHPLMDTIVALRPVKVPTPFTVPNSVRPLNPAYPLDAVDAGFTNLDPYTGNPRTEPVINKEFNFGHEYLWHCHILSHEEQDMMRVIVLNANQLVYSLNAGNGFWQWNRGEWDQIAALDPIEVVSHGTYAYAKYADGLWEWDGYKWTKITSLVPEKMVASSSGLYASFTDYGLYKWNRNAWTKINNKLPTDMVASGDGLYASFTEYGLYQWNGTWVKLNSKLPIDGSMVASENGLYANFTGYGFNLWNGVSWTKLSSLLPSKVVTSGSYLFANFDSYGLYEWNGTAWRRLNSKLPDDMVASAQILYANFTDYGLYEWNGRQWVRINTDLASDMVASGSVLYAVFGAGGDVSKYEFGSWSDLGNTTQVTQLASGF